MFISNHYFLNLEFPFKYMGWQWRHTVSNGYRRHVGSIQYNTVCCSGVTS